MSNADNFLQFMFGWHHGAGRKGIDETRSKHKDQEFAALYLEGYQKGQEDSRKAALEASKRFDYKPSIIRAI